ncbi:hypothetical protein NLO413_1046 [Candidatus Neoehrlichia lotoris str. RAC413]|uniref:Uncharacterized protein n=1 Tax=Candidatus Neoehrlichia procyonis str. RAC413 TaxID=1359163 RepID=A0A0F3NPH5_9RICK|nr:hypothetical protein NLO413_1046 [Candidatus Neoehrlichia lotoris str. RAC413]
MLHNVYYQDFLVILLPKLNNIQSSNTIILATNHLINNN